jgi:exodeoxyribonuclease V alpha subunit
MQGNPTTQRPASDSNVAEILSSFEPLDREFAAFLLRLANSHSRDLALAAALVSRNTRAGHVCLDLNDPPLATEEMDLAEPVLPTPAVHEWRAALEQTSVVGNPGEFKPLILDPKARLYLHRYWNYETIVAQGILSRAKHTDGADGSSRTSELSTLLDRYFPPSEDNEPNGQRLAVQTAITRRFTVISGGPGTGKTYTIAVLLAVLLEFSTSRPRIALTAPTGKAAVRLQEAIQNARQELPIPAEVRDRIPSTASTLHRLLGATGSRFIHGPGNLLPFDWVIIDEASMVDLALMAKLFAACPPSARIILVGDMNQLASVEAGAVLGDVCHGLRRPEPAMGSTAAPLRECIVELRKNYRYQGGDGFSAFSQAVKDGDTVTVLELLKSDGSRTLRAVPLPSPDRLAEALRERVLQHFQGLLAATTPAQALAVHSNFRILCALRKGPFGTDALNENIEKLLIETGTIEARTSFYAGRPILIRKNDYNLRLFNGDVGIILPHAETNEPRAWFLNAEGQLRDFATGRLPEHETVFAMTVHKSQGSEFQNVLLILPDRDSPVLCRELLYTGATRVRQSLEVWMEEKTFCITLNRQTRRRSGLADRLWKGEK